MSAGAETLRQADLELHARLGIGADLLAALPVSRVDDAGGRQLLGGQHRGDLSGVVYPRVHPIGGHPRGYRIRRDHHEVEAGKPKNKYLSSIDRSCLFFSPGAGPLLSNTSIPIVLLEAEKSGLASTAAATRMARPLLAIALGGVYGWKGRIGKTTDAHGARVDEHGPSPDLDLITWTNRDVVIMFDANVSTNRKVQAARRALAAELISRAAKVRLADLPVEDGVNGPDDYIGKRGDDAFFAILDAAKPAPRAGDADGGDDDRPKESQATILIRLAREAGADFFRDDDQAFVHVPSGDHHETYTLRSRLGRAWLQGLFIDATGKCPGSQAIADASNSLEAFALRGSDRRVFVRIAATMNHIYLDLGDPSWRAVEMSATGWRLVSSVPVRFRRPKGLLPLPVPQTGGRFEQLRPYVNVAHDDDFMLLMMVMVAMLRGRGPYPALVENGEQGSAKSTQARIIKSLIDPNVAPLRSEPRDARDLMIAAANNHVLAFDNVSSVAPWLSDALCRLATGGGFSTRMLYENAEEQIFDAVRPVILNGISEFATRPDLVSRAVLLHLPRIAETAYRDERSFWAEFERDRPFILGALLDLTVAALRQEAHVQLERKPRMADFAVWAVAAETACPWPAGRFLDVYAGNRHAAAEATLEGDPVADLVRVLTKTTAWIGTAADLLVELNKRTSETTQRRPDWFKKPRQVSDALRRLAPALRQVGIEVTLGRVGHVKRGIHLEQKGADASASSVSSARPDSIDETCGRSTDPPSSASSATSSASSASSADLANVYGVSDAADAADADLPFRSSQREDPIDGDDAHEDHDDAGRV